MYALYRSIVHTCALNGSGISCAHAYTHTLSKHDKDFYQIIDITTKFSNLPVLNKVHNGTVILRHVCYVRGCNPLAYVVRHWISGIGFPSGSPS